MWQALRSDLKEFVSVVTDPNASKDDEYDDAEEISPALEEAMRRMALEETYTVALLDDDGVDETALEEDTSLNVSAAEDAAAARDQIQEYIDSFSLEANEDEIAKALDSYGEILQPILQRLVPEIVSRKDFWMRYFYHCSVDQIQQEIAEQENRERIERVSQSIQGVKSFLGGAVMSVASSILEDDEGGLPGISPFHMSSSGNRRPPFVMNTAVDEDDDVENEEELGWSDEDDGEDDDDETEEDNEAQIEFKDAATEQLQEQLKQALEERDMLHQTVELQQKQIVELIAQKYGTTDGYNVDELKLQLFDKESELAALRSSERNEPDTREEQIEALQQENAQLKSDLKEMEARATFVDDGRLASLQSEKTELQAKLLELQVAEKVSTNVSIDSKETMQKMQALENEVATFKTLVESKESDHEAVVRSLQSEIVELRQLIATLENEKSKLSADLGDKASEITDLTAMHAKSITVLDAKTDALVQENTELKAEIKAKTLELINLRSRNDSPSMRMESPGVESAASPESVVKVDLDDGIDDPQVPSEDLRKVDGGSDDWGDDWGGSDEDD
ncbi:hypothetical protein MPSEU_000700800 [Mayamaea pseudoterrestris]|nr:hypothetical protein MPSEU_000700800 [Mayamaea pseudoterrestris]